MPSLEEKIQMSSLIEAKTTEFSDQFLAALVDRKQCQVDIKKKTVCGHYFQTRGKLSNTAQRLVIVYSIRFLHTKMCS